MSDLRIPLDYEEKKLHRSVWNLSEPCVTSLMQCLNVPVKFEILKPKDEIEAQYKFIMQSMPMVGQLLNNWKLRIFSFVSDLSNYYSWMDNNSRTKPDEIKQRRHHFISPYFGNTTQYNSVAGYLLNGYRGFNDTAYLTPMLSILPAASSASTSEWPLARVEMFCVQSESVLNMVGFARGFFPSRKYDAQNNPYDPAYTFNADYILTYLDSVRNYMVNNQYPRVPYTYRLPVITSLSTDSYGYDGYQAMVGYVDLSEIDEFFRLLRLQKNGVDIYKLAINNQLYSLCAWMCSLKYGGFFHAQYERDMLTNLLYTDNYDDVLIQVDEDGRFSINQLRFANKTQLKADREGIAGGRYSNELRTVWGAKNNKRMDIPELVGVSSFVVDPKGVVTTADTYDAETGTGNAVGQLNGVVNQRDNSNYTNNISVSNHSILMYMVQLVPDVYYSAGLGKGLDIQMFDDEYAPQLDNLGFQDVPRYKYNCLPMYSSDGMLSFTDSGNTYDSVVGKNIPFIDLISNVGRIYGKFSSDEYFSTWVLQNTFDKSVEVPYANSADTSITSKIIGEPQTAISPYANPLDYQYPFAVQSVDDPNFIFLFGLGIRAVRSKGKSYMPTLGD